jgi:hypothetical protein
MGQVEGYEGLTTPRIKLNSEPGLSRSDFRGLGVNRFTTVLKRKTLPNSLLEDQTNTCKLLLEPLMDDIPSVNSDRLREQDWYEQALQTEAPIRAPRASWSEDDDEDVVDDVETEDEVETDPFDDFDEEDFDDDFDDDFEEELEDEYEIEPADDGAVVESFEEVEDNEEDEEEDID